MYIVSRTFRDAKGVFKVGSIIEPTDVKAFKSRLQQRHIININEQNVDKWAQYFINRHGIDLTEKLKEALAGVPTEEPKTDEVTSEPVAEVIEVEATEEAKVEESKPSEETEAIKQSEVTENKHVDNAPEVTENNSEDSNTDTEAW